MDADHLIIDGDSAGFSLLQRHLLNYLSLAPALTTSSRNGARPHKGATCSRLPPSPRRIARLRTWRQQLGQTMSPTAWALFVLWVGFMIAMPHIVSMGAEMTLTVSLSVSVLLQGAVVLAILWPHWGAAKPCVRSQSWRCSRGAWKPSARRQAFPSAATTTRPDYSHSCSTCRC
ncbi:MAG: hypothetical protein R2856_09660 [Caldilineaceae bacterium]